MVLPAAQRAPFPAPPTSPRVLVFSSCSEFCSTPYPISLARSWVPDVRVVPLSPIAINQLTDFLYSPGLSGWLGPPTCYWYPWKHCWHCPRRSPSLSRGSGPDDFEHDQQYCLNSFTIYPSGHCGQRGIRNVEVRIEKQPGLF